MAKVVSVKSVRRIVIFNEAGEALCLQGGGAGKKKRKKRKQTFFIRPFEKAQRTMVEATQRASAEYLARHDASNRANRDGWVRDMNRNVFKAVRKGAKAFKLNPLS